MILTAEQYWMVANVYEKVAADKLGVPPRQRAAFARKAMRFRMLARLAAKIEATAVVKQALPLKPRQTTVPQEPCASNSEWRPKARYQTLAEQLETARAAASSNIAKRPPGRSEALGAIGAPRKALALSGSVTSPTD
jgi:hypothetical protein